MADDRGKGQAHGHESAGPELGGIVRSLEPWPGYEHEVDVGEDDVHARDGRRDLRPPVRSRDGKGNEADDERRGRHEQGDVAGPDIRIADEARVVEPPVPVEVGADPTSAREDHRTCSEEYGKAHGKADERRACVDEEPLPASLALGHEPHRAHREPHREREEERIGVEHDEPAGDEPGERARQPSRLRPAEGAPGGEGEEQCCRSHDRAREVRVAHITEDHRVERRDERDAHSQRAVARLLHEQVDRSDDDEDEQEAPDGETGEWISGRDEEPDRRDVAEPRPCVCGLECTVGDVAPEERERCVELRVGGVEAGPLA